MVTSRSTPPRHKLLVSPISYTRGSTSSRRSTEHQKAELTPAFFREPNTVPPPRIERVEIVAFDDVAAIAMAKFPSDSTIVQSAGGKKVLKYDAMIIACGLRHQAECLISCDERQRKLATRLG